MVPKVCYNEVFPYLWGAKHSLILLLRLSRLFSVIFVLVLVLVLASESWCNDSKAPSVRSPAVDEERMSPGHWLELLLCVPFSALTRMVGSQEGHPAHQKLCFTNPRGSFLDQIKEETRGTGWNGSPGELLLSEVDSSLINSIVFTAFIRMLIHITDMCQSYTID